MKIAILTSFPLDVRAGSGVVRTLEGFCSAFRSAGNTCRIFHQETCPDYSNLNRKRLEFNEHLKNLDLSLFDLVIGSDFDGWLLDTDNLQDYVVFCGGVLADITRFEKGEAKKDLLDFADKEKINLEKARLVLAPSQYAADKICSLYKIPSAKIKTVPLGIDLSEWDSLFAKSGKTVGREKIILCTAKQYPRKGIADLIKAFALVCKELPDARLIIAGGGPEFKNNQNIAKQHGIDSKINFIGDVSDKTKLAAYYKNSTVFCLPSYHETFGLVLLEAMAAGLPVVTYDTAAIPETANDENAILVNPGDIDGLADSLCRVLQDKQLAENLGKNSRRKAEKMSWQKSAELFLEACTLK